jgi:iron(III) transport system permease protein
VATELLPSRPGAIAAKATAGGGVGIAGLLLAVFLALLVLPPVAILLQGSVASVAPDGTVTGWTLEHYRKLVTSHLAILVRNSLVFAAASTLVSLLVGGVLAWLVERTNTPFKALAYLTTLVSMGTPYVLYVTAWLFLFGRAGPFNDLYRTFVNPDGVLFNVYSLAGMVAIEGFLWSPLVFLLMSATFRSANADLEEAARMSGAGVLDTVRRVSLPMAKPAIAALALFVFIRNIEAFEVPALVGLPGGVRVLTTDIFLSLKAVPPDLGHASAFSTLLLVAVAILLQYYGRLSRHAERFHSITGKGFRPRPLDLGRWRAAGGAIVLLNHLVVLALPITGLLWIATQRFVRPIGREGLGTFTLDHFRAVLGSPYYVELVVNTLIAAGGAALVVVAIAAVAAWFAARRKPFGQAIDQLMTMPLVFPGIVLGVAVLQVALRLPVPIYGTLWVIVMAFVIRYLPYGMRYAYAGTLQVHRELEEAASVSGASPFTALRRIVVPLVSPALLSAALFIFLLGAKELTMAILLASPSSQTLAVAMFDLWVNGQGGELAALGLVWTAVMSIVASGLYFLARRRGLDVVGQ